MAAASGRDTVQDVLELNRNYELLRLGIGAPWAAAFYVARRYEQAFAAFSLSTILLAWALTYTPRIPPSSADRRSPKTP